MKPRSGKERKAALILLLTLGFCATALIAVALMVFARVGWPGTMLYLAVVAGFMALVAIDAIIG